MKVKSIIMKRMVFFMMSILVLQYAVAQQTDSTKASTAPVFTGSFDAYYRFNFSNPVPLASGNSITHANNYTSFTNSHNSFELGMASIRADHSLGKANATIDLGFGKRAEEFSYGNAENTTLFAIKQAYVAFAVSDKFKFTLGKWATHIGYELVDAYLNRNYSMSYMFSYGPFSHTGIKADLALGKKSALMLGVANSTDNATTTASCKYIIGQFSTATADNKVKAYFNYQGSYADSSYLTQFDVVVTAALTSKFSIGYNGTVQFVKAYQANGNPWWGSALYFNLDPTSNFGITLRGEYFDNKKDVLSSAPSSVFEATLSPNFKIGNLTLIPELRVDAGSEYIFVKHNNASNKSTVSGIFAATYHF